MKLKARVLSKENEFGTQRSPDLLEATACTSIIFVAISCQVLSLKALPHAQHEQWWSAERLKSLATECQRLFHPNWETKSQKKNICNECHGNCC